MAKRKRTPQPPRPAVATEPEAAAAPPRRSVPTSRPRGDLGRLRRSRREGNPLPWIVGLAGLAALVAIQVGVNVVREARFPGERLPSQGNVHVALGTSTPAYNSDPPTSGWHTSDLAPWGSHLEPLPDQRVVHNLEDGGVALWYANGTPEENRAQVAALEAVVAGRYARIVIAPREGMPTPYTLTAWRRLQRFDAIDEPAMREFIAAYHGTDHHPR